MAIVEVSIIPIGTGSSSLSSYVAGVLRVLSEAEDIKYQLTPMGTIIEGDLNRILEVIKKMHDSVFSDDISRVVTTIKIDDRRDKNASMEQKLNSVDQKLKS
ncbi:MAG: MTH1187 family thiamine-binding protein [Halobacteriota archaeon]|nr:MTH1187 family thiamine-binding protein [Halobacteriota archaeon]